MMAKESYDHNIMIIEKLPTHFVLVIGSPLPYSLSLSLCLSPLEVPSGKSWH